ncbi:hypothetical protein CK203_077949 [Vitis vinifera]|uniref:Uncharacterized protein n=1 Tax=Vitis vinifera TaxID=29760 RepID=A0A438EB88_VITVI|nr:hypothetical protein CK203_077949 [Vitis vinifera]
MLQYLSQSSHVLGKMLRNHISCIRKKEKEVPGQGNLPMLVQ